MKNLKEFRENDKCLMEVPENKHDNLMKMFCRISEDKFDFMNSIIFGKSIIKKRKVINGQEFPIYYHPINIIDKTPEEIYSAFYKYNEDKTIKIYLYWILYVNGLIKIIRSEEEDEE